jgi:hypothetical protein
MGGLAEALFVIAIELAVRVSAVNSVVNVLRHGEFSFGGCLHSGMRLGSSRSK